MPLSYILLIVMKILKEHKMKTTISKKQLGSVITEFLVESFLPDEVKDALLEDFDFEYELQLIMDNYGYYFYCEDNMIDLSPYTKISTIDNLLEEVSGEYDRDLIDIIDDFFEFNIPILEIIGIKIDTNLYQKCLEIEENIEKGYESLAKADIEMNKIPDNVLSKLKKNIIKRKIVFNQMKHSLSLEEYNDLRLYSAHVSDCLNIDIANFKIENEEINFTLEEDPFHRALFFNDSEKELVFAESFYADNKYKSDEFKNKEIFYTMVLDVIDSRVNREEYDDVDNELIFSKYRLMYVLDMLYQDEKKYNGYLFLNDRLPNKSLDNDYSFIEDEIFYLIEEIFEYNEMEMVDYYYDNSIKAILIETYYDLTNDERVVTTIKKHFNNGKNYFANQLFDSILNKSKKKIKRKEEDK